MTVRYGSSVLHLDLGERAERWAERLRNPPTRADKLGLKSGDTVCLIGTFANDFHAELDARQVQVVESGATWILLHAPTGAHLRQLPPLGASRALWIVYPRADVAEQEDLQAGRSAGLTDHKVMRFSPIETALKFVTRKKK